MSKRGLGKFRGAYLATRILSILVRGASILEMGMERVEEGTTSAGGSWKGDGSKIIPVESPGIGSSQEAVFEDAQTLKNFDVLTNS